MIAFVKSGVAFVDKEEVDCLLDGLKAYVTIDKITIIYNRQRILFFFSEVVQEERVGSFEGEVMPPRRLKKAECDDILCAAAHQDARRYLCFRDPTADPIPALKKRGLGAVLKRTPHG